MYFKVNINERRLGAGDRFEIDSSESYRIITIKSIDNLNTDRSVTYEHSGSSLLTNKTWREEKEAPMSDFITMVGGGGFTYIPKRLGFT